MTETDPTHLRATVHLQHSAQVGFSAAQLWPMHGAYARFGNDLPAFAEEVTRRLSADGYVGFSPGGNKITVLPVSSIDRVDFSVTI